ncbi:HIT family protein [Halobacterium yunchengense]|uniref:HIT family protein n=1 Tax=Halobacterium yunchengense TaxID=3108497 RepID=UPI003AB86C5A
MAGDAPADLVYEGEQVVAFLDAAPAAPGHTLVVPKSHHETLLDVPDDVAGRLFRTARRVAQSLEANFDHGGFNLVQSNGAAAGQDVFHAHVHVIPRSDDDDVTLTWEPRDRDAQPQRAIAASVREGLDAGSR